MAKPEKTQSFSNVCSDDYGDDEDCDLTDDVYQEQLPEEQPLEEQLLEE